MYGYTLLVPMNQRVLNKLSKEQYIYIYIYKHTHTYTLAFLKQEFGEDFGVCILNLQIV